MNTQSSTSPFTLVSRFDPQQQQFVDVDPTPTPRVPLFAEIYHSTPEKPRANEAARAAALTVKAAPERAKVSAVTNKTPKKPVTKRTAKKTTPAPEAQPTLTTAELDMIVNTRKLTEKRQEAMQQFVAGLAKQAEHPTEETPAVTLDPEPETEPTPNPIDANAQPAEWGNMSFDRRAELAYIPDAIQTVGLLMSNGLMHFDPMFGDHWNEGFGYAVRIIAQAMYRVEQEHPVADIATVTQPHLERGKFAKN